MRETVRRVVTGPGENGRSVIVSDEEIQPTRFQHTPGFRTAVLATTPAILSPARNAARGDMSDGPIVPPACGATFVLIDFPPDAVMVSAGFDARLAGKEMLEKLPGFAELFEPDAPGMHSTPTIDYAMLISGELWLELGDGSVTRLSPGDTVIQNGSRHAWRNRSQTTATLAVVMTGAAAPE